MSLISSKDGMLPGGGTPPPLIAESASYKFSQIYIHIYYLKMKLHKIKTSKEWCIRYFGLLYEEELL